MAGQIEADIAVVGLGIMGAATLWRLAERGANVVGFEQFAPGHDKGSSHGEARIIRSAYFEDPGYVPLIAHAFRLWAELQEKSNTNLLVHCGALMIGDQDSVVVKGTLESARVHNLPHKVLDAEAMSKRYPQHRLEQGEIAIYEDAAGVLRPEAAVVAAANVAEQLGAKIERNTVVERLEANADSVTLYVNGAARKFRQVVVAVGPWLNELLPRLNMPVKVERQVQVWFNVADKELYKPENCPVYIRQFRSGVSDYGFPSLDGTTAKIGIHHDGQITLASAIDRAVHPADIERLQKIVATYMTGLDTTPARSSVCMYDNSVDDNFIIGHAPNLPNVTIMGGFSGHGFKFGAVLGDAVADLVLTGATNYPIDLFAPERFLTRDV